MKKPDMPRGEILEEMKPKPKGELRQVIVELAKASGAYIIVSAAGSTADSALKSRRDAMAEAVKGTHPTPKNSHWISTTAAGSLRGCAVMRV